MKTAWLTKISSIFWLVISWLMMSAVLCVLVGTFVVDQVPLGPRFLYAVVAAGVLTLTTTSGATICLWRKSVQVQNQSTGNRLTRKQVLLMVAVVALVVVTIPLTGAADREIQERMNRKAAEDSMQTFHAVSFLTNGESFDEEAINQTLAELEDSYQKLKNEWALPDVTIILVQMYRNLSTYQEYTGLLDAAGHVSCTEDGPVISIPLEKAPSSSSANAFTRTPAHEVAHALLCLSVGPEACYSIPPWFHEGTAQRYEVQGFRRSRMRAQNRVWTWFNQDKFLAPERFCSKWFIPQDSQENSMLYSTSLEFTKSLDAKYGVKNVNLLADDVRRGAEFNDGMVRRFGRNCEDLYKEWKGSF